MRIERHHLVQRRGAAHVDLVHAGGADELGGVVLVDATTGHDRDATCRLSDGSGEVRAAVPGVLALAGGEDALDAEADQCLQCTRRIAADIPRAVEGERQSARGLLPCQDRRFVDVALRRERADHHAMDAALAGMRDIGGHDGDLVGIIDERAAAEPDDREDGNPERLHGGDEHAVARRRPGVG